MCSKLHKDLGKPALLSLRLGKTKITKHNHVFYLNNTQLSGIEFEALKEYEATLRE